MDWPGLGVQFGTGSEYITWLKCGRFFDPDEKKEEEEGEDEDEDEDEGDDVFVEPCNDDRLSLWLSLVGTMDSFTAA